jgi:hypothetical protein
MMSGSAMGAQGSDIRSLLRAELVRAAHDFGLSPRGKVVFGWRDRSIGSAVAGRGDVCWLRVVWARPEWARGSWWTGNQDAAQLRGVSKPALIEVSQQGEGPLVFRAELMTLVPGRPCAPAPVVVRDPPAVDSSWWAELASSLRVLAATSTVRRAVDPENIRQRIAVFFGQRVDTDVRDWTASHGDLHWNNLHSEPFAIVDWEAWGLAPRGYDAAFLLCHSLAVPDVAEEIRRRFASDLNTDDGVISQLYVLTKMLTRADGGEYSELIDTLHRHADRLLGRTSPTRQLTQGERL